MTEELDALVYQYLELIQAGTDEEVALEQLCTSHPDQASALRRGVGLLRKARLHPGPSEDGLPDRIGPFRLSRRLGIGGMGVVYLAEQEHPTRQVALKLVRPDQLWFDGYRERFTREIESAGRLAHPGIAQVYQMGEHDGVPWFSQEFVVGAPLNTLLAGVPTRSPETLRGSDLRAALAEALEDQVPDSAWDEEFFRGSWVEVCLRIARQVAEALQHAHERGVLHRDVKPSNVLLTPAGRAVLVDFGLASLQGADGESRLTKTGAQLGSLHYMPPEQVDGRTLEVGPRSDVYSLGITLFELLTLRAPYASQSVQRLRGMILAGDAPDIRKLNAQVTRDAQVLCATAIDPQISRRYATAADFAADLSAVLGHRAIAARPAGPGVRLGRWARRRPALAVAAVATFLLLIVTPTVLALQSRAASRRLQRANDALEQAVRERDTLLDATLEGFRGVIRDTAHDALRDVPGFQEKRLELMDRGLALFDRVVATRPDDVAVRLQQALMLRTRANILAILGRHEAAAEQFEQAAAPIEAVVVGSADELEWRRELASLRHTQALSKLALGNLDAALELQRDAVGHQRRALELDPLEHRNHGDLARMASALADRIHARSGDRAEADDLVREALAAAQRGVALAPEEWDAHQALYEAYAVRADWAVEARTFERALSDLLAAQVAIERALELAPTDREIRRQHVRAWRLTSSTQLKLGQRPDEFLPGLERAVELAAGLVADYPSVPGMLRELIDTRAGLARAKRAAGDREGGLRLSEQVLTERVELARRTGEAEHSLLAASEAHNLASGLLASGEVEPEQAERALALCSWAEELLEPYRAIHPDAPEVRNLALLLPHKRALAHARLGQPAQLAEQIEVLRALEDRNSLRPFLIAILLNRAFELTGDQALRPQVIAALELAVELGFADLATWNGSELELGYADFARFGQLAAVVRARAGER